MLFNFRASRLDPHDSVVVQQIVARGVQCPENVAHVPE